MLWYIIYNTLPHVADWISKLSSILHCHHSPKYVKRHGWLWIFKTDDFGRNVNTPKPITNCLLFVNCISNLISNFQKSETAKYCYCSFSFVKLIVYLSGFSMLKKEILLHHLLFFSQWFAIFRVEPIFFVTRSGLWV